MKKTKYLDYVQLPMNMIKSIPLAFRICEGLSCWWARQKQIINR